MVENPPAMQEMWVGKIPWRREWLPTPVFFPGEPHKQRSLVGLPSMGWQRVGRDSSTEHTHTHTHKGIHNSKNISLQDKLEKTLIGKDPDAGKDWRQEEKGMTEDEMVGCHHWLNGHEFEQALGVGDGQGGLACCSPWGHSRTWLIG